MYALFSLFCCRRDSFLIRHVQLSSWPSLTHMSDSRSLSCHSYCFFFSLGSRLRLHSQLYIFQPFCVLFSLFVVRSSSVFNISILCLFSTKIYTFIFQFFFLFSLLINMILYLLLNRVLCFVFCNEFSPSSFVPFPL